MKVLAIETSCDETAAAVLEDQTDGGVDVRANVVYSQIDVHRQFGGVYPEAASREHVAKIGYVIEATLREAGRFSDSKLKTQNSKLRNYLKREIDLIAVTTGPGLIGSLLVGVNAAKTLAYVFGKPIIGINHHEGHIAAAWLAPSIPALPAIALVVSGGHTTLVLMKNIGQFEVLGKTRDDAVGEAFDKVARLLGLPYPGGPAIAAAALEISKYRNIEISRLPRPMLDSGDLNFSFSGLKTAVAQLVARQKTLTPSVKAAIAHEFQEAAVDVLVAKTLAAITKYRPKSLIVAGGVAANKRLREAMAESLQLKAYDLQLCIPPAEYCTDNAAMIGAAALLRARQGKTGAWPAVHADDSLALGALHG